jgi:hypothetical protein
MSGLRKNLAHIGVGLVGEDVLDGRVERLLARP